MNYTYDMSNEKEFKRVGIFKRPPIGFLIFDSYNNEWFPLKTVKLDKSTFSLRLLKDEFHREYGGSATLELFMPFHYLVEFIGKNYNAIVTRPINYKSLIPGYENYITICIAGDSNSDLYAPDIYKTIAHEIMNPIHYIPGWKLNPDGSTTYHNLAKSFKTSILEKNFR